jgi:hypothetical protein
MRLTEPRALQKPHRNESNAMRVLWWRVTARPLEAGK